VTCYRVNFTFSFILFFLSSCSVAVHLAYLSTFRHFAGCSWATAAEVGPTFLEDELLRWFESKTRVIFLTSRKSNVMCHGWRERAFLCASDIRMRCLSTAPIFSSDLKIAAWMVKSYCAWNIRKNVQILQHVPVRCNVTCTRDFDKLNVTVVTAGVSLWRSAVRVSFVEPFGCKLFFSLEF